MWFQLPYTVVALDVPSVIALVRPDISTLGQYAIAVSSVIVPVTDPAFVNVAVSCGKGKKFVFGVPVDVSVQPLALQFCAPAKFQYTVLGVLNVIPLHSPLLPMRVPLMGAAVPLTYKPRKSASVRLGALFTTRSWEMP